MPANPGASASIAKANDVGARVEQLALRVAVAESLTGGLLASRLAQVEGSSAWFLGGVVAYATEIKVRVLGVRPGPAVSEEAAVEMAAGVARLFGADLAVALTGVGGPDPQDGQPPGTVWVGLSVSGNTSALLFRLSGSPEQICEDACAAALDLLDRQLALGFDTIRTARL